MLAKPTTVEQGKLVFFILWWCKLFKQFLKLTGYISHGLVVFIHLARQYKELQSLWWFLLQWMCVGRSHGLWVVKLGVGSIPGGWRLRDASTRWNIDSKSWRQLQAMGYIWTIHAAVCKSSIHASAQSLTGLYHLSEKGFAECHHKTAFT